MIQSRKGLSDIVTNVLIILLVLVAVGIIWAFVRPTINQGAGQLQGSNECLTADVQAISCVRNASGQTGFNVSYRRNAGAGTLQEVKFIFKDASGNSKVISQTANLPSELESKSVMSVDVGAGTGWTFDTAVVVAVSNNPAGKTCPERAASVACN